MKWNKYSIKTTTEAVDLISCMLSEYGIEGIEIEDNVQLTQEEAKTMFVDFIPELPPDDGTARVNFYVDSDEDDNTILDKVKEGLEELRTFTDVGEGTITESQTMRIPTGVLNSILTEAVAMQQPPSDKGKRLRIYYMTQVAVKPPTFVMFVNDKELTHFSYTRYIENKIRDAFGFRGTAIHFINRERKEKE